MSNEVQVYVRTNCMIRIPGHGQFMPQDMRFDPQNKKLAIRMPEGMVSFGMDDMFQVELLDLDVPTAIRNQMKDNGWESVPMKRVIQTMLYSFLSEN